MAVAVCETITDEAESPAAPDARRKERAQRLQWILPQKEALPRRERLYAFYKYQALTSSRRMTHVPTGRTGARVASRPSISTWMVGKKSAHTASRM